MSRVLSRTYRQHNRQPGIVMSIVYFVGAIFMVFHGMGGLEKNVDLPVQEFCRYLGIMLGGVAVAAWQASCWLRGH